MPLLRDISFSSINQDDFQMQMKSVVKQINEWGRLISNEDITRVYKDNSGTNRIIIGVLPDNTTGLIISKEGVDVLNVFD